MKIENTMTKETKNEVVKFQNRFRQNINRIKTSLGY